MLNFLLTLAGHLGMTLNRLLAEMGRDELLLWMGKNKIDPIGPLRSDYHAAATRATMINLAHLAGENKRPDEVTIDEMMPTFGTGTAGGSPILNERDLWEAWANGYEGA